VRADRLRSVNALRIGVMLVLTDKTASDFAVARGDEKRTSECMFIGQQVQMHTELNTPTPESAARSSRLDAIAEEVSTYLHP
jgi:hypothetical protein